MLQIIKNIISFVIIALLLILGYFLFIEKKSVSEILDIGKEAVEDKALELKVESQISFNKQFQNTDISVKAEEGEVTLSGTVGNAEQAMLAAQIANNVEGVTRVFNKIKISAELDTKSGPDGRSERERLQDKELEEKAEAVLATNDKMKGSKIGVTVFKRVIFLDGTVISIEQKDIAVQLIRSIEKVRDVKEELRVKYE